MAIPAVIHIIGEDAFLADLEEMPNPTHTYISMSNMRKKDGKLLPYITDGATSFLYAWSRITFIEIMGDHPGAASAVKTPGPQGTTVLGFFRDEEN